MDLIERTTEQHDTQVIERDGGKYLEGYGAVYYDGTPGTEYRMGDNLYERVQKGAFDKVLAERQNVQLRYNHSDDYVLTTVEDGLTLRSDDRGVRYSAKHDDADPQFQTVKSKINKHIIKGSSFGAFGPQYRFSDENGKHIAWLTSVEVLRDLGPVNNPAYKSANTMIRSATDQYQQWLTRKAETEKRLAKLKG